LVFLSMFSMKRGMVIMPKPPTRANADCSFHSITFCGAAVGDGAADVGAAEVAGALAAGAGAWGVAGALEQAAIVISARISTRLANSKIPFLANFVPPFF